MTRRPQNRRWIASLVILVLAVALGKLAAAEPRSETARADLERRLAELKRQARDLEAQIRRIEAQLDRDQSSSVVASRPDDLGKQSGTADCSWPFYLDSTGLKRVRTECLETSSGSLCDVPFTLDGDGIRRLRPACDPAAPASGLPIEAR